MKSIDENEDENELVTTAENTDKETELAITAESSDEGNDDSVDMYVKFSKPYIFEDDTYKGLDMSCLENLTTGDLMTIEKSYYKLGITAITPENTVAYAKIAAQKATGLPIEFFNQLPVKEMMKIKSRVVNFFYN